MIDAAKSKRSNKKLKKLAPVGTIPSGSCSKLDGASRSSRGRAVTQRWGELSLEEIDERVLRWARRMAEGSRACRRTAGPCGRRESGAGSRRHAGRGHDDSL